MTSLSTVSAPIILHRRTFISFAALLVNVTTLHGESSRRGSAECESSGSHRVQQSLCEDQAAQRRALDAPSQAWRRVATHTSCSGGILRSSTRYATRVVRTAVLPLPGPAWTANPPSGLAVTALRCSSLRRSRN